MIHVDQPYVSGIRDRADSLQVICVMGMAYSGSTLLNYCLDGHPRIFGGGELHWLLAPDKASFDWDVACTNCGTGCPYWTKNLINSLSLETFYQGMARAFSTSIIVDTSKEWDWFGRVLHTGANREVMPILLVLTKHPLRHLASHLANKEAFSPASQHVSRWSGLRRQFLMRKYVARFHRWYQRLFSLMPSDYITHRVRYEDVAERPWETLAPVMSSLRVENSPLVSQPYRFVHHQIGGNAGTHFIATKNWLGGESDVHALRRAQYQRSDVMFLDNKYQQLFSASEIKYLFRDYKYRNLCELLGYDTDPLSTNRRS